VVTLYIYECETYDADTATRLVWQNTGVLVRALWRKANHGTSKMQTELGMVFHME